MPLIHSIVRAGRALLAAGALALSAPAGAVGGMPVPGLDQVTATSGVARDPANGHFTYRYTIASGAQNRGMIYQLIVDVSASAAAQLHDSAAFRLPAPGGGKSFAELRLALDVMNDYKKARGIFDDEFAGTRHIPFGLDAPPGWVGLPTVNGGAMLLLGDGQTGIHPSEVRDGFALHSYGHPTLREMRVSPFWIHVVADHDAVGNDELARAETVEAHLDRMRPVLAPGEASYGSLQHWDAVRDDLARMRVLGWISDPVWGDAVALANARQALDDRDLHLAKQRLAQVQALVEASHAVQRQGAVAGHLRENLRLLAEWTADNPVEPKLVLTPAKTEATLGESRQFTLTLTDRANGGRPIVGGYVTFQVEEGPHAGLWQAAETDADGQARFSYQGRRQGVDRIRVQAGAGEISFPAEARAIWIGAADLVVPLFVPPLLETAGGNTFRIVESTENLGNVAAGESTTRYYIASEPITDIRAARVLGERRVPALPPDAESRMNETIYRIPADLPAGTYHLAACADAGGEVIERDEANNCSYHAIAGRSSTVLPARPATRPPHCDGAAASPATLWPPNHRWADIRIGGISHPDARPFTVRIASITQDEPTNGLGDGDTAPDGAGIGGATARVRAERSGKGNGRVYRIGFNARDDRGQTCSGSVVVTVPHDQSPGGAAIDNGQAYDSTR